jgi:hypothetical protein
VAITIVSSENKDVPEWRRKGGYTFPILLGNEAFARDGYGVTGAPTTFLLDSDHKSVFLHLGFPTGGEKTLEAEIRELLGLDPFAGTVE